MVVSSSPKIYKVDLDYEASLFDQNYHEDSPANNKIIREFEYVFFLAEKDICHLKNCKCYEKKYLDNLRELGFTIPILDPQATSYDYWWGFHHDREVEQICNSKLTSAKLAKAHQWGFSEGAIVETLVDLKNHLAKFPERENWILKSPHGFSGIGHRQFNIKNIDDNILTKMLMGSSLLEPVYERIFDIGTTFIVENGVIQKQFMVLNFISPSGAFLGGAGAKNGDKFKKYILKKFSFSLDELETTTQLIAKKYLELGAVSNIQIDSFIYLDQGVLKTYALVEVNYRKTMGLIIQSLAERFDSDSDELVQWKIQPAKLAAPGAEWIKLSPEGNMFQSFFKKS